jgi:hypothetical protein
MALLTGGGREGVAVHVGYYLFPLFPDGEVCLVNSRRIFDNPISSDCSPYGAMVQRLARGPFKAEIRVRFPLALPSLPRISPL